MTPLERLRKFGDDNIDRVLLQISRGSVKCGKYAHLVKINKGKIIKGKEFFTNGESDNN